MKTIARLSVLSFIVFFLVTAGGSMARAAIPADAYWETRYYPAGVQGTIYSMLSRPGALFVGGNISAVGGVPFENVVRFETNSGVVTGATALGDGLDGKVAAFCEHDGQAIAGGLFDNSGNTVLNRVALWDGGAWQPLGAGLPGVSVQALASYGAQLFAGAYAWDGSTWTNVLQTDGAVTELVVHDGLLYVGGDFTEARGVSVANVFAWDGSDVIPLGAGFPEAVISADAGPTGPVFATDSWDYYGKVYRWDGVDWVIERENTVVNSVGCFGSDLIVSNSIFVSPHNYQPATQSDATGSWVTVGSFVSNAMCEHEGVLFLQADAGDQLGVLSPGLIGFDGAGMQEVLSPDQGCSPNFQALAPFGAGVLVGGDFAIADGQEFDGAALTSEGTWSPFGGRSDLLTPFPGRFKELEVLGTDYFGVFSYIDWDIEAEILVKCVWTGTEWEWQGLESAFPFYGDLVVVGSELINVYGQGVRTVEPVSGALTPLPGLDLDGFISGSCAYLGDLVICGGFAMNGGVPVSNVLRYSGGSWQDVGAPLPGSVVAVTAMEGVGLAAALRYGYSDYRVALFDGISWTVLDGEFDYEISHLQFHRSRLFVAGGFGMVGRTPAPGIVAWTGTKWAPVGSGFSGGYRWSRTTDMVSSGDHLWVAGTFTTAGGQPSVGLAEWTGDPATLTGEPSGVQEDVPGATLLLGRPFPNPFNPRTTVSFELPRDARVRIGVYDVRGTRVCTLTDRDYSAGAHAVVWAGEDDSGQAQPSGVYFARLMVDGIQEVVKLTLIR